MPWSGGWASGRETERERGCEVKRVTAVKANKSDQSRGEFSGEDIGECSITLKFAVFAKLNTAVSTPAEASRVYPVQPGSQSRKS